MREHQCEQTCPQHLTGVRISQYAEMRGISMGEDKKDLQDNKPQELHTTGSTTKPKEEQRPSTNEARTGAANEQSERKEKEREKQVQEAGKSRQQKVRDLWEQHLSRKEQQDLQTRLTVEALIQQGIGPEEAEQTVDIGRQSLARTEWRNYYRTRHNEKGIPDQDQARVEYYIRKGLTPRHIYTQEAGSGRQEEVKELWEEQAGQESAHDASEQIKMGIAPQDAEPDASQERAQQVKEEWEEYYAKVLQQPITEEDRKKIDYFSQKGLRWRSVYAGEFAIAGASADDDPEDEPTTPPTPDDDDPSVDRSAGAPRRPGKPIAWESPEKIEEIKADLNATWGVVEQMNTQQLRKVQAAIDTLRQHGEFDPIEMAEGMRRYAQRMSDLKTHEAHRKMAEQMGWDPDDPAAILRIKEMEARPKNEAERIIALHERIKTETDVQRVRDSFIYLQRYVKQVHTSAVSEGTLRLSEDTKQLFAAVAERTEEQITIMNIDQLRADAARIVEEKKIAQYYPPAETKRLQGKGTIQSLEELAQYIVESQGGDFQTGKKYEIVDARGEIVMGNLIAWIRSRLVDLRNNTPDGQIDAFSGIYIPISFRQISLGELVFVPQYFQKQKVVITGEENGFVKNEQVNDIDSDYNDIREKLLMEAWLFSTSHSNDAGYRSIKGQEAELMKSFGNFYAKNIFTKNRSRLLSILKMHQSGNLSAAERRPGGEQGKVGEAIQTAILAYYHMAELALGKDAGLERKYNVDSNNKKEMEKVNHFFYYLGEQGSKVFFQTLVEEMLAKKFSGSLTEGNTTIKGIEELARGIRNTIKADRGPNAPELDKSDTQLVMESPEMRRQLAARLKGEFGLTERELEYYGSNPEELAKILLRNVWRIGKGEELKKLNIFAFKKVEPEFAEMVRRSITQAVSRPLGLSKNDTDYAGHWAYSMVYWTGIGAKNDTEAQGFDAFSKLLNFRDYRMRGMQGRGGSGNKENLPGFQRLSMTMWDAFLVRYDINADLGHNAEEAALAAQIRTETDEKKRVALEKKLAALQEKKNDFKTTLMEAMKMKINGRRQIQDFDFPGEASTDYASLHVGNAYKLMQFLLEKQEMKLSSIVKTDPTTGNFIFDHDAATALMDSGAWKAIRYAFDQPSFEWSSQIRAWHSSETIDRRTGAKKRKLSFGTRDLRSYMFNDEIRRMAMHEEQINGKTEAPGTEKKMARNVFAYLIAKEIKAHRRFSTSYSRWPIRTLQEIEAFFALFAEQVEMTEDGNTTTLKTTRSFFTEREWDKILRLINSSYGRMYAEEFVIASAQGTLKGFFDALGLFIKQSLKI